MNYHVLKSKIEDILANRNLDEKQVLSQLNLLLGEIEISENSELIPKRIVDAVHEITQKNQISDQSNVVKTGYFNFDQMFGGFKLSELVVVGARPSIGKTQFLVNLSLNISVDIPVLFCSFESSELLLTSRFISSMSGIPFNKILQQDITLNQKENLISIESKFFRHQLFINVNCKNSISLFKAQCIKQIEENGIKVIVVDCLQLMSPSISPYKRELEISFIIKELKNLSKEYNVCVIVSSQLSRAVESRGGARIPYLTDLCESGAIEQVADKVIFLYRPECYGIECDEFGYSTIGLMELILAKNRNGITGTVKLIRDANFTRFHIANV